MKTKTKENLMLGIALISLGFTTISGVKGWITMKDLIDLWNNLNPWKTAFVGFSLIFIVSIVIYLVDNVKEFKRINKEKIAKLETDFEAKYKIMFDDIKQTEKQIFNNLYDDVQRIFTKISESEKDIFSDISKWSKETIKEYHNFIESTKKPEK